MAKCLNSLSRWAIFLIMLFCFVVLSFRKDTLAEWLKLIWITISADVFFFVLFVITLTFGISCATAMFCGVSACIMLSLLMNFALDMTIAWFSLVKIAQLHELDIKCGFPSSCGDDSSPNLSGIAGFFGSWLWQPVGLFKCVGDVFLRPWAILGGNIPDEWGKWREVIIGTVIWILALFLILVICLARIETDASDRGFLFVIGLISLCMFTYIVYMLTTAPAVQVWSFLGNVVAKIPSIFRGKPTLEPEECIVLFFMGWLLVRFLYSVYSARLEQWSARARIEASLKHALEHPFFATLQSGFGEQSIPHRITRSFSRGPTSEQLKGLKQKHEILIAKRKKQLRDSVALDEELPRTLHISVRRESLLKDTCKNLLEMPVPELLASNVRVIFEGEGASDAGGVTRDWFDSVARALMEDAASDSGELMTTAPDQTLMPRPAELDSADDTERFRALLSVGRFMALAVYRQNPLPLAFSLVACKYLLQEPVSMHDVRRLDPEFYRNRVELALQDGGLAEIEAALGEPLTFMSAPTEHRRIPEELVPGGASKVVTLENRQEYVQLLCEHWLCGSIRREIKCLLQGFWDLLPAEVLLDAELNPRELSVLITGLADLDPVDWRSHSTSGSTEQHEWFWQLVTDFNAEQRCLLLHFATGSSRLPPGGFAALTPRFQVEVTSAGTETHLPHAHTCVNKLVLHRYPSKEELRDKLSVALLSTEGFGFA